MQLDTIPPDLCVKFVDAWRQDLDDWQRFSNGVNNVGSTREAMDFLRLKNWTRAEFGAVIVESQTTPGQLMRSSGRLMPNLSRHSNRAAGRQELPLPGWLETERLVGALRVVIDFQRAKQQIGLPHPALCLGDGVCNKSPEHPASTMRRRHPGGLDVSIRGSLWARW